MDCNGQPVLPVGMADVPGRARVKLFCPRCQNAYHVPPSDAWNRTDGAFFGKTFPHLLLLCKPELQPSVRAATSPFTPRIFGFRVAGDAGSRYDAKEAAALEKAERVARMTQLALAWAPSGDAAQRAGGGAAAAEEAAGAEEAEVGADGAAAGATAPAASPATVTRDAHTGRAADDQGVEGTPGDLERREGRPRKRVRDAAAV